MQLNVFKYRKAQAGNDRWGIPTIQDRIVQAIYLEVIDLIVEAQSCLNSYGFRKFRSAGDAVLSLRENLIHPKASE